MIQADSNLNVLFIMLYMKVLKVLNDPAWRDSLVQSGLIEVEADGGKQSGYEYWHRISVYCITKHT